MNQLLAGVLPLAFTGLSAPAEAPAVVVCDWMSETPMPNGVPPATLCLQHSGSFELSEDLAGAARADLVKGGLDYIAAVASAMPIDEKAEAELDRVAAKLDQRRQVTPLKRRIDQER